MGKNYYLKDRDILDQALEHSWGKSAEAKAKERAYNREYYQRHKEEILRKARQAGEGIQRTAQNAYDYGRKLANDAKTSQNMRGHVQKERFVDAAGRMGSKFLRKSADYFKTHGDNEYYDKAMRTARDYSRLRSGTAQAINEADKLARQNSPVERVKRDLRRTTAGARDTAQNAINDVRAAFSNERRQASSPMDRNTIRSYERAHEMNNRLLGDAKNRFSNAENRVQESNTRAERFRRASDAERRKYDSEVERAKALRADPRTSQLAVDARTEADSHLSKAAEYQKMAREAGQETYNHLNESNRAYKNQRRMANRRAASGAALNEASKAAQRDDWGVYDKRFDSKLARDLQNTKAKARGAMSKAEKAAQQAREEAKKRMKKWFGHSDYSYKKNELCHHGIKDQKWGVRRFQYEDGTLTPAGRERYRDDTGSNTARVELPNGGTLKRSNGVWQHITNNPFDEYSQVSNSYAIGQLFKALASNYGTGTSRVDLSNGGTLKNVNGQWKYISDNPLDEYRDISEDYATTLMMKEYKQRT